MSTQQAVAATTEALATEQNDANSAATAQAETEEEAQPSQIFWEQKREKQLKEKHDKAYEHRELLLKRRRLSSGDLKVLVTFAEHFGLDFDVEENLGRFGWADGRHGLMISISDSPF